MDIYKRRVYQNQREGTAPPCRGAVASHKFCYPLLLSDKLSFRMHKFIPHHKSTRLRTVLFLTINRHINISEHYFIRPAYPSGSYTQHIKPLRQPHGCRFSGLQPEFIPQPTVGTHDFTDCIRRNRHANFSVLTIHTHLRFNPCFHPGTYKSRQHAITVQMHKGRTGIRPHGKVLPIHSGCRWQKSKRKGMLPTRNKHRTFIQAKSSAPRQNKRCDT